MLWTLSGETVFSRETKSIWVWVWVLYVDNMVAEGVIARIEEFGYKAGSIGPRVGYCPEG